MFGLYVMVEWLALVFCIPQIFRLKSRRQIVRHVRHQNFVLQVDWYAYFAIKIQLHTEIFGSFMLITQTDFTMQSLCLAWECFVHRVIYLIPNSNLGIIFSPFEIHCSSKTLKVRILLYEGARCLWILLQVAFIIFHNYIGYYSLSKSICIFFSDFWKWYSGWIWWMLVSKT